jgi:hypothetical protein
MITNTEKEQIHKELLPFWLFYKVEHEVNDLAFDKLRTNFKDADSYKRYIKQFIRVNETLFFKHIVLLDRGAFIIEINDQFNNYNIRCFDMTDWLKTTYKLIVNGLSSSKINLQSKSEFLEWYKIKTVSTAFIDLEQIDVINEIENTVMTFDEVYNHYIETGRFGFAVFWNYKDHEFDKIVSDLNRSKERFDYVFNKLSNNSKIELKNDYCDRLEILKNKQSKTKFKEIIENLIIEINNDYLLYNQKTEATGITAITSTFEKPKAKDYKNIISDFNLNEFNEITFNLFNYLIVNYNKKGKVKYLNIFRYLKEINKDSYAFNFTQKTYKEYIYKKYEVELTTFNTANFEFDDKEKPILSGFEQAFRDIKP